MRFAPLLTDVFVDAHPIVWFRFVVGGDGDLEPRRCADEMIGHGSEWVSDGADGDLMRFVPAADSYIEDLRSECGWEAFFLDVSNWRDFKWTSFALAKGLAPGQPFAVRLTIDSTCDYWGEYDLDLDAEIVQIIPWPPARTLRSWTASCRRLGVDLNIGVQRV